MLLELLSLYLSSVDVFGTTLAALNSCLFHSPFNLFNSKVPALEGRTLFGLKCSNPNNILNIIRSLHGAFIIQFCPFNQQKIAFADEW